MNAPEVDYCGRQKQSCWTAAICFFGNIDAYPSSATRALLTHVLGLFGVILLILLPAPPLFNAVITEI